MTKNPKINTRKIGDDLEDKVLEVLAPYFSKTAGSGSVFKDGDLRNHEIVGEIKVRGTSGASIAGKDFKKLKKEALKQGKEWLFVCENESKDLITMTDLNFFSIMYESYLIAEFLSKQNKNLYKKIRQEVMYNKGREVI